MKILDNEVLPIIHGGIDAASTIFGCTVASVISNAINKPYENGFNNSLMYHSRTSKALCLGLSCGYFFFSLGVLAHEYFKPEGEM
jgi:hypothetical protein